MRRNTTVTCGRPSRPVARRPPPSGALGTGGPLRLAPEAEAGPRWRLRTQMEPRSPARRVAGAGGPPHRGRDWPSAGGRWARRECDGHGACDWPSMAPQDGRWTARVPDLGTDPGHRGPRPGLRVSTPSTGGGWRVGAGLTVGTCVAVTHRPHGPVGALGWSCLCLVEGSEAGPRVAPAPSASPGVGLDTSGILSPLAWSPSVQSSGLKPGLWAELLRPTAAGPRSLTPLSSPGTGA